MCELSISESNMNTTVPRGTQNIEYAQFIHDKEIAWVCASFLMCTGIAKFWARGEAPSKDWVWDNNVAAERLHVIKAVIVRNVVLVE